MQVRVWALSGPRESVGSFRANDSVTMEQRSKNIPLPKQGASQPKCKAKSKAKPKASPKASPKEAEETPQPKKVAAKRAAKAKA